MPSKIAAQLYTLREFTKTPADVAKTLAKVRKIGYEAVQKSAVGPMDPKEFAKILQGEGLACCATHISLDEMNNKTQQVIDDHTLWGCHYTALGWYGGKDAAEWEKFSADYSATAKKFAGSGVSIGYHNHSHELVKYGPKTAMQIMIDKMDPSVWFEIDTYWITHGGGDPCQWIEKVGGRIPCVHLKDMSINAERKQLMAEVGEGNLNWLKIIDTCAKAGVKWYIVEQDDCNGKDPFDCLERSFKNVKAMGVE